MQPQVVTALLAELGPDIIRTGSDIDERFKEDLLRNRGAEPVAVLLPRTTEDVSRALRICNTMGVPVCTQGGRSGLVLSTVPQEGEIVLSTGRLRAIESIDVDAATAVVQSGVVLQTLQDQLEAMGLSFPLDLGARGSCTVGGNASTNAGGNRVIRYGMTRELILGLEAVLADGTVLDGLKPFLKNNTGTDLKHLFIGTEGTLGVITRLVLKLIPKPNARLVVLAGTSTFANVRALLRLAREQLGGDLSAFEVMWKDYYSRFLMMRPDQAALPDVHDFYVLIECAGSQERELSTRFEQLLESALEQGLLTDAVVAKSESECESLWDIRDLSVEISNSLGARVGFDVSLRIADMEAFAAELREVARSIGSPAEPLVFGHLGDGNLHLVLANPGGTQDTADDVEEAVYALVARYGGSISAEHGIGIKRKEYLGHTRTPAEIETMRTLKRALDPKNTLNPGRILDVSA